MQPNLKKTVQSKPAEKEDKKETIVNVKKNKKDL